jgi:phosphoribosylglycinamide formyltransferase-1
MTLDVGILVSGSGTNMQAIIDASQSGSLDVRVRVVISNRPDAPALDRAKRAGLTTRVVQHKQFATRESFDQALVEALREHGAEWVALAGFMRLLTPVFLDAFPMRVVNIHPALLPAFPGVNAHQQALDYGVRITGCTVHFVDKGTDTGPIIGQYAVPVLANDTRDSLAQRLIQCEHELYVEVLRWIADRRVSIVPPSREGERARVRVEGVNPWLGLTGTT